MSESVTKAIETWGWTGTCSMIEAIETAHGIRIQNETYRKGAGDFH